MDHSEENTYNNIGSQIWQQGTINNYGTINNVHGQYLTEKLDEKKIEILQKLNKLPYGERKNRNPDRTPRTCEWVITHELFKDWQESESSRMLWISADPGCGKSVLAKYLIDHILTTTQTRTTCYFFFKDNPEDQSSIVNALCCILRQLFQQKATLLSETIVKRFEVDGELYSSFIDLWDVLLSAAKDKNAGEIVCILDAIDECEDHGMPQLANGLYKLYGAERNSNLKFLITSRPYIKIERSFQPLMASLSLIRLSGESETEITKISQEIDFFIAARVRAIGEELDLESGEKHLLQQRLRRVPNRTYLWVHLTLNLIKDTIEIGETEIDRLTSNLPKTVDEAYERILYKADKKKARKLLHIVTAAARPLTLEEMNLALALEDNHQSYSDLKLTPERRFRKNVRELCGLLLTIIDSRIYLLHQTVKEFLIQNDLANAAKNDSIWKHSLQPQDSHRVLANICIRHLFFAEFEAHPLDNDTIPAQYAERNIFLDYSAKHWATHLRESQNELDDTAIRSIQSLCDASSKRCLTWFRIYWTGTNTNFPENFTTLMIASYFGFAKVVRLLTESGGIDLNSKDDTHGRSAISWAAGNGFDIVVALLIRGITSQWKGIWLPVGERVRIDAVDNYGRTPLLHAVWNRHVAVVELLLKAGAQADLADNVGGTPLLYAICSGYTDVVEQLVEGGAEMDSKGDKIGALLLSAAERGREDVVKRLLEIGEVNPDFEDGNNQTPLSRAIDQSNVSIVITTLMADTVVVDYGR
ncbi:hypothetical protein TWF106_005914, partial [Orbilia oligospora]